MSKKVSNIISIVLVCCIIIGFFAFTIVLPKQEYSLSERRELKKLPELTISSVFSGNYMISLRDWCADHFPLRDPLRTIKAYTAYNLFNLGDNNGIYFYGNQICKIEYPMNDIAITRAVNIFNEIYNRDLKNKANNIYLSVIPDKNCFTAKPSGKLFYDANAFANSLAEKMPFAKYIDVVPLLNETDYYNTDIHIKQDSQIPIAKEILIKMGGNKGISFTQNTADNKFYGVYYGQAALKTKGDDFVYLTNDAINSATVYDFETQKTLPVYDLSKLNSENLYETFLHGSKSLMTIKNENAKTNKQLVIFRDSFASNLAPLLISEYSEITLIDIRYISAKAAASFIDYTGCDVLFLYSTPVINASNQFKR